MLGFAEQLPSIVQRGLTDAVDRVAQKHRVSRAEVLSIPAAREFLNAAKGFPEQFEDQVRTELLKPAGGYLAVANAPGLAAVTRAVESAVMGGAVRVGLALLMIAILDQHHWAECQPSLNRALRVVDEGIPGGRSVRAQIDDWQRWRCVAPIWAVIGARILAYAAQGCPLSAVGDNILDMLTKPAQLREALGYAQWFRRFATTFKAPGARDVLLPPFDAVEITRSIRPIDPMLPGRVPANASDREGVPSTEVPVMATGSATQAEAFSRRGRIARQLMMLRGAASSAAAVLIGLPAQKAAMFSTVWRK